ncbi:serine/threonine protein kinase [Magnaporthiopsis poae ATCC 64411]|uniref:Serine/threonine protein kinase n=1 Tax=Magnaporthiopsis poae (strain ATCC 64411 / 73-15) TaxID=644358 RepID=A0A0C4DZS3_MAGP6|nr:serine/threonine protein kinase [Magnaporthiopsis poae ATCC 64411]
MSRRMPEDEAEEPLDVYAYMEKQSIYQYLSEPAASSFDVAALSERYSTHQYISGHIGVDCFDMISSSQSTRAEREDLFVELASLRALRHQHVVRIAGSYTDLTSVAYLMEPVSELSLDTYLNLKSSFNQNDRRFAQQFFGCLAGAVSYMHRPGIGIGHLSARNIFISSQHRLFLSGFGATLQHPPEPEYAAPELGTQNQDDLAGDVWDLGIVFLKITMWLLGAPPGILPQWLDFLSSEPGRRPPLCEHLPSLLEWMANQGKPGSRYGKRYQKPVNLVSSLLHSNPQCRPASHEVVEELLSWEDWSEFCCTECRGESQTSGHGSTQLWADPIPLEALALGHAPRGMEARASDQVADRPWALQDGATPGADSGNTLLSQLPTRLSSTGPLARTSLSGMPVYEYGIISGLPRPAILPPTGLNSAGPLAGTRLSGVPGYDERDIVSAFLRNAQHAIPSPIETSDDVLECHADSDHPPPVVSSPTGPYSSDSVTDASSDGGWFRHDGASSPKSTPATSFSTLAEPSDEAAYCAPEDLYETAAPYGDLGADSSNQERFPPSRPSSPPANSPASRNSLPATFSTTSTRTTRSSAPVRSHHSSDTSNSKQHAGRLAPLMRCAPDATITKGLIDCCANARSRPLRQFLEEAVSRGLTRSCRKALLRALAGASSRHNRCARVVLECVNDADTMVNRVDSARGTTALGLAVEHPDFHGYEKLVCCCLRLGHGRKPRSAAVESRDGTASSDP